MHLYEEYMVGGTPIIVFSDHNYALPIWGKYSSKNEAPYHLITFDYHADTHSPLAHFASCSQTFAEYGPDHPAIQKLLKGRKYKREDFCLEDAIHIAEHVRNDEHIQTVDWFGYINSYTVICHLSEYEARCYQEQDIRNYNAATYYNKDCFNRLPVSNVEKMSSKPFILDFDLDFFTSPSCFSEAFTERGAILIKKASLITIAREPTFCPSRADWNCEMALSRLVDLIEHSIT